MAQIYSELSKQLVFIMGVPRSGTTMLYQALLNQPSITGSMRESSFAFKRKHNINEYLRSDYYPKILNDEEIRTIYEKADCSVSFFAETARYILKRESALYFLEKTPHHIRRYDYINYHFPNAKIILIHRNPKAVIYSMTKTNWIKFYSKRWKLPHWVQLLEGIIRHNRNAKYISSVHSLNNSLTIKYEDAVLEKIDLKPTIGNILGVDFASFNIAGAKAFSPESTSEKNFDASRVIAYKSEIPFLMLKLIDFFAINFDKKS